MSWEKAEMQEVAVGRVNEKNRETLILGEAEKLAVTLQQATDELVANDENKTALYDDSPDGKKRYMAAILHEAAKKIGITPDELKEASVKNVF